jgi:exopolysaccharide biosynthesis operon protein EpsL
MNNRHDNTRHQPDRILHALATSRRLKAVLVACAALLPAAEATALWDDKLELFIQETVTYDDNVFRLPDGVNPVGATKRSDTSFTTSPGFNLDIPYSRQRFVGGLRWNFVRYNTFKELDFDGHEARAAWLWQAGNDLSGQLGYTQTEALASLANSRDGLLLGTPNSLDTQRFFLNASYNLTPRWGLRGEVSRLEQENSLPQQQFNNIVIDAAEAGVFYITPLKNSVGVGVRLEDGNYPERGFVPGTGLYESYQQVNVDGIVDYNITGRSRLNLRAGIVSRRHDEVPQLDFDEGTYRLTWDWQAPGNFAMNTVLRREVSPLDDTYATFVLVTGVILTPTLRLTEKISLGATLDYSSREYLTEGVALVVDRHDRVRTAILGLSYRALRAVTLNLSVMHQTRTSSVPFDDYEANVAGATLRVAF